MNAGRLLAKKNSKRSVGFVIRTSETRVNKGNSGALKSLMDLATKLKHIKRASFLILMLFVLSLVGFSRIKSPAASNTDEKDRPWFKYAEEYVYYDKILTSNLTKAKHAFTEDYRARQEAETKLVNSVAPSSDELQRLLMSSAMLDKQVALVNIMARQIQESETYNMILRLLTTESDYFTRFYCYHCFNKLASDQLQNFREGLIDVFLKERNEILIIAGMPTLTRIESPRIGSVFHRYLDEGSDGLRRAICTNLETIDRRYIEGDKNLLAKKSEICK